jgi:hypothetical protein
MARELGVAESGAIEAEATGYRIDGRVIPVIQSSGKLWHTSTITHLESR